MRLLEPAASAGRRCDSLAPASLSYTRLGPAGAPRLGSCASRTAGAASPPPAWGWRPERDPVRSLRDSAVQSWDPAKVHGAPAASKTVCWGPTEPGDASAGGLQGVTTWVGSLQRLRAGGVQRLRAGVFEVRGLFLIGPPKELNSSPAVTNHFSRFRVSVPDSMNDF